MIFISYNHYDQDLVDMIARRLEIEFGRNNIFYDKWTIQPDDSIIEQMNMGLESYSVFFFMFSTNSLKSEMVEKEWQSALYRKIGNESLKFIPVRIDNCIPPAIIADQLYINLYGDGLDSAINQMKNVINNESTYIPNKDPDNIVYSEQRITDTKVKVTVKAKMYSEHNLSIVIGVPDIPNSNLKFDDVSETMSTGADGEALMGGKKVSLKKIGLIRPLDKENPFFVTISTKNNEPIKEVIVAKLEDDSLSFITKE